MQVEKNLQEKFVEATSSETVIKKPAVAHSLNDFLHGESSRLKQLLRKKRQQELKNSKISEDSLRYRMSLQQSLSQSQKRHERNRSEFLAKRVKAQKFKISEVQRKREELMKKRRQDNRKQEEIFRSTSQQTKNFWTKKFNDTHEANLKQTSASTLYQKALTRKKMIEDQNFYVGQKAKDQIFQRHDNIRDKKVYLIMHEKQRLDAHTDTINKNLLRNSEIKAKKESEFINKICQSQNQSQCLLKTQQKAWEKKLQDRRYDVNEAFLTVKQRSQQFHKKRSESMRACDRLGKLKQIEASMKTSSVFYPKVKQSNNQQEDQGRNIKFNRTMSNMSVLSMRQSFMKSSENIKKVVLNNQSIIKQRQAAKDQKKIMIQREISEALKEKQKIKDETNSLIRQNRIIG